MKKLSFVFVAISISFFSLIVLLPSVHRENSIADAKRKPTPTPTPIYKPTNTPTPTTSASGSALLR